MAIRNVFFLAVPFLMAFLLLASSGAAQADERRQVWRDTEGAIVHNSWGMCVRSIWDTDVDPCATKEPAESAERAEITREDRTVYFAFDRADLTAEARNKLDTLAGNAKSTEGVQGAEIAGYADRIGTDSYNLELSARRAESVRNYLLARDIVPADVVKTRWLGKSEPSTNCPSGLTREKLIACLQADRKVEVDILYGPPAPEPEQGTEPVAPAQ
jgi:outer membrane protein OmpA-like peptidoglycan-associated protein